MIALFVRPATPGRAKTRLISALGAQGAARLYRAMALDVIDQARCVPSHSLTLWTAGATNDSDLAFLPDDLPRRAQLESDLGARMLAALQTTLKSCEHAMVLGSDAPGMDASALSRGFDQLRQADVVLGPAADGGYTLIAAKRTHARMFEGVRFSSRHALADTQHACVQAGLTIGLVAPWFDVDIPADLSTLRALLAVAPGRAPHTAATLRELDS